MHYLMGGGNAVLMRRQSCVEAYAEDAQAPASSFGSDKEGSARHNSLPAGTASHTEDQPSGVLPSPVTAVGLFPYCRLKQVGRFHMGDVPLKTAGKATHALQCSCSP